MYGAQLLCLGEGKRNTMFIHHHQDYTLKFVPCKEQWKIKNKNKTSGASFL